MTRAGGLRLVRMYCGNETLDARRLQTSMARARLKHSIGATRPSRCPSPPRPSPRHLLSPGTAWQATLNHSCEPNVSLLKDEEDEKVGKVVARLARDVAADEELCNAYIDVNLPLAARQLELKEYGFVCCCAKCEREKPAASAAAPKAKASGKRRLK